ncbi:MAG: NAD(P)-dependent oxidoreductase [Sphingomonadaceae bacterium]|nr:NAD(P)-dependent oxidoreductase [Sphingomonadaceae bacterium]
MKILIVGGTGMIGIHTAAHLRGLGHEVTLGARRAPATGTLAAEFPMLLGDYTQGDLTAADLAPFDAIVFSAGNDIRHIGPADDRAEFWRRTQIEGVPNFIALARAAGVPRVVHLGSYYHQVMPHLVDTDDYVRARALADEGARALATPDFNVSTLNPPSIVGIVPGTKVPRYTTLIAYARGELDVPVFAPLGGTNYMSVRSLAQAISGALRNAESGRAYLIGDENLSYRDYFQLFFDAVGNPHQLEARDEDHPLLPLAYMIPGRNSVLAYEPDAQETAMLGYARGDVRRALDEIVAAHG